MAQVYDIIIFGASGFTGKHVVKEALKFVSPDSPIKTLALAGRNSTKLTEALKWASPSHPDVPILIADSSNEPSLRRMASQARIVLNCVGPYRLHGDAVVDACVEAGCDYLDICGEPEFMERMEAVYYDKAVEMGSLVVSACGFDSVPAELGLMFNSMQWVSPAVPNRVEAYVQLESSKRIVGNFATYESAVLGLANVENLVKLRRSSPRRKRVRPSIPGYAPPPSGFEVEHQKKIGLWGIKLPSADASIIRRTLSLLAEYPSGLQGGYEDPKHAEKRATFWSQIKPAHFGVKIASKTRLGLQFFIAIGTIMGKLSSSPLGRWLLLTFPAVFTFGVFKKRCPTTAEVASGSFKMWFVGHGFSDASRVSAETDMQIVTRIKGPEIGYVTTPIILIQCALILLKQRGDLPNGGVFPPGIVFGPTDLQSRLQNNGISFEVISKSAISA